MKEDIRFIEIQLPQDSKIIKALVASRNKEKNIDSVEISLYLGKGKKPLKIILRPKDDSLDFDVTTPLNSGGKAEVPIGKAEISKAILVGIPINSANLFDSYSLSIEIVEQPTNFTKSFIERIKVLKDELGVARETLRLTGDIFHILPNAKKGFNIVKNKINFEHFASPGIGSLNQKETPSSSKSEEKNSECTCWESNELSELFERMREFLNKLPVTQIESVSQIDIDTKNGNKPSGYTCKVKTIHPSPTPSPVARPEDCKELKVFVSSHILESDAIRAMEEWTRKLNKNRNNGDLFTTKFTAIGAVSIPFGFIHGFSIEAEESANSTYTMHRTKTAYTMHRAKTYSIYANIKINITNMMENKLAVTKENIKAVVICSLERLNPRKDENEKKDKKRNLSEITERFAERFINKDNVSAPKADKTLVVPFSIVLKDVIAYNHLLEYTKYYKATFRIKDKLFKGEIKSINIQDFYTTTVNTRRASPSSIKAIVNIAITQECKDTIDNLVRKMGIDFEVVCVGSLDHYFLNKSIGALYTIKSYAEREDIQTINIDMSLNPVRNLERFSHLVNKYANLPFTVSTDPFTVSTDNKQAARIIYCADTEEEAVNLIMNIKEKLKNRFTENRSKQSNFSIYDSYINVEIKSFSSDSTILKVQDVVLVASKDLGKYFVIAKLQ